MKSLLLKNKTFTKGLQMRKLLGIMALLVAQIQPVDPDQTLLFALGLCCTVQDGTQSITFGPLTENTVDINLHTDKRMFIIPVKHKAGGNNAKIKSALLDILDNVSLVTQPAYSTAPRWRLAQQGPDLMQLQMNMEPTPIFFALPRNEGVTGPELLPKEQLESPRHAGVTGPELLPEQCKPEGLSTRGPVAITKVDLSDVTRPEPLDVGTPGKSTSQCSTSFPMASEKPNEPPLTRFQDYLPANSRDRPLSNQSDKASSGTDPLAHETDSPTPPGDLDSLAYSSASPFSSGSSWLDTEFILNPLPIPVSLGDSDAEIDGPVDPKLPRIHLGPPVLPPRSATDSIVPSSTQSTPRFPDPKTVKKQTPSSPQVPGLLLPEPPKVPQLPLREKLEPGSLPLAMPSGRHRKTPTAELVVPVPPTTPGQPRPVHTQPVVPPTSPTTPGRPRRVVHTQPVVPPTPPTTPGQPRPVHTQPVVPPTSPTTPGRPRRVVHTQPVVPPVHTQLVVPVPFERLSGKLFHPKVRHIKSKAVKALLSKEIKLTQQEVFNECLGTTGTVLLYDRLHQIFALDQLLQQISLPVPQSNVLEQLLPSDLLTNPSSNLQAIAQLETEMRDNMVNYLASKNNSVKGFEMFIDFNEQLAGRSQYTNQYLTLEFLKSFLDELKKKPEQRGGD